jgi:hypothetical protein
MISKKETISGLSEFTADCPPRPLAKPTFNPPTGTAVPVTVSIECSVADAEIYYSLDSNDPEKGQANTFLDADGDGIANEKNDSLKTRDLTIGNDSRPRGAKSPTLHK